MNRNSLQTTILAAVLVGTVSFAPAQWVGVHNGNDHNAVAATAATVADLTVDAQYSTGASDLSTSCRPVIAGSNVYAVAQQTGPDRIWVKSFDKSDLSFVSESADLDVGITVSYTGQALPTVDAGNDALYMNSGSTVYRFTASDLSLNAMWSTTLDTSNTDPTGDFAFVNGSPVLAEGKVLVRTYPTGWGDVASSQVVALDQSTGAVSWYGKVGGRGAASPLFVDLGATKLVVSDSNTDANNTVLTAFDITSTGSATPVWTSSALSAGSYNGIWCEAVYANSKIYGVTSDFTDGFLFRIDPATGTMEESLAIPASDCPPVFVGGSLFVLQGDGYLYKYNPVDFTQTPDSVQVAAFVYRDFLAATTDSIYLAKSGFGVRQFSLSDLSVLTSTTNTDFTGPVSVDEATGYIYTYGANNDLNVITGTADVSDWMNLNW